MTHKPPGDGVTIRPELDTPYRVFYVTAWGYAADHLFGGVAEDRLGALGGLSGRSALNESRHHRVFEGGELGEEVVKLKHKTDFLIPDPGAGSIF